MVEYENDINFIEIIELLRNFEERCLDNDGHKVKIKEVKWSEPGKLGRQDDLKRIGTIQFKLNIDEDDINKKSNISVLLFKHKMKISGGISHKVQESIINNMYDNHVLQSYVTEVSKIVKLFLYDISNISIFKDPKIFLINGNQRTGYKIGNFMAFCRNNFENSLLYHKVVMPLVNIRGRIGAVKLYPYPTKKSSAHFDKGGHIQYFAFTSTKPMYELSEHLIKVIK